MEFLIGFLASPAHTIVAFMAGAALSPVVMVLWQKYVGTEAPVLDETAAATVVKAAESAVTSVEQQVK